MVSDSEDTKEKAKETLIDTEIKENISWASFQSMYSEIYQLFNQKEADFPRRMQEIKDGIHQAIYGPMEKNPSDLRQGHKTINYHRIVTEWPPTGSKFTTTGGYVLPDGGHIPRELRQKVERLRQEFDLRDPVRYPTQKVDPNKFSYIGKVLQQGEGSSSKN